MCCHVQVLRASLWSAWAFLFFQEAATTLVSANHNIPKCLLLLPPARTTAAAAAAVGEVDEREVERDVDDVNIFLEDLRDHCFPSSSSGSALSPDRLRVVDPVDSLCIAEWVRGEQ